VPAGYDADGVRLCELVATLSYAADLGLGQPLAHCMRKTVLALRLADLVDASEADRQATFYTGLLANVYCHADASEQASWFGDDIAFKGDGFAMLAMSTPQIIALFLRHTASHGSPAQRARRVAALPGARKRVVDFLTTHATLASQFATRLGLAPEVATSIRHTYEQWDGSGLPQRLSGTQIGLPARLAALAGPVEVYARTGTAAARDMARRHAGRVYDPGLVDMFCAHADELLDGLDAAADWDVFLGAQTALGGPMTDADLDAALEAMADLVDMKSPCFAGHCRGVANLATAAATALGWAPADVTALRRAALLHDLGRLGTSNAILDKPGPLTRAEREHIRLQPHLTERMLIGVRVLDRSRAIAARHHERLDGTGYPHGLTAAALTPPDRLLAVADMYHAMTEPRSYRDPLDPSQASGVIRDEVAAGRLDAAMATAVLTVAGHRVPVRRPQPDGLTPREVEVLALLARGHTTSQIATRLVLAPKTVGNHIEHLYAKLGITSRAAATLYAMQHGLVNAYQAG
jgi:putative nucleotidyltransferase with HDIG domain